MSITKALEGAGFKKEKSTAGERPIIEGVFKATVVELAKMEDKGYGESIYGQFKISETLSGYESNSKFPEFKQYFNLAPENIGNKKRGLAKLINGLFSVGIDLDTSSDEALMTSLDSAKGAEVFINAYKAKKWAKEGDGFVEVEGEYKQDCVFMTEKNALKKAKSAGKEKAPF